VQASWLAWAYFKTEMALFEANRKMGDEIAVPLPRRGIYAVLPGRNLPLHGKPWCFWTGELGVFFS
jgi:hypothetical protein